MCFSLKMVSLSFSRGNDECNKKQPSDCDTLEYRNGEGKISLNSSANFLLDCFKLK